MKIKVGDNVRVMAGKDKGKTGKVIQIFPSEGKVVVEKVNMLKKHIRSRERGKSGQRIELAAPFAASRVQIVCPHCAAITRAGFSLQGEGKTRVCRKCKAAL